MTDLSAKELKALEDQLQRERDLTRTFKSMAGEASDPQLKAKYEQIASRHQEHFSRLFGYL
ncbi:MAG: spore coat protein [Clostridiales bacterium]|nr:spore coat protein [Clostridiales bacterium]